MEQGILNRRITKAIIPNVTQIINVEEDFSSKRIVEDEIFHHFNVTDTRLELSDQMYQAIQDAWVEKGMHQYAKSLAEKLISRTLVANDLRETIAEHPF